MARPSHLSPDNILRFLQVRTDPASADDISRGLHLKRSDRNSLFKMLSKLKKRGAIREFPGGRYHLAGSKRENDPASASSESSRPNQSSSGSSPTPSPRRDELTGRLVLHHDGYGFVVPDTPTPQYAGDIFIPRTSIEDAMHGDHVLAKILRTGTGHGPQRAEGRIVRVLNRAHPSVVGLFRYGQRGNYVLPYDARMQHSVEILPGDELTPQLAEKLGLPAPSAGRSHRTRAETSCKPRPPHRRTRRRRRQRRNPEIPARRRISHWTRDRNYRPPRRSRRGHRDHHPQASPAARLPAGSHRRSRIARATRHRNRHAGTRRFSPSPDRHNRRRNRARFRRCRLRREEVRWLVALASSHRRRRALCPHHDAARQRSAPPRHQRLFSRSRRSDASRSAIERNVFAQAARRSSRHERVDGIRRARQHDRLAHDQRNHQVGRAHDVHQRQQSARRRR